MRVAVFGMKEEWDKAVNLLLTNRKDVTILGLCDPTDTELAKQNDAVYTQEEMLNQYHAGLFEAIVNVDESRLSWNQYLQGQGIENYAIPTKYYQMQEISPTQTEDILRPFDAIRPELHNLEFQIADHCNLRCKACTHFSNLVKEPVFADKQQFEKDLVRLAELFDNIREFHLMGGEPLLNPEVGDYCHLVRSAFPYSEILLVTNGLLILSMKPELLETIKETEAIISISDYGCIDVNGIVRFLQENGIEHFQLRYGKEMFTKNLNPKADADVNAVFEKCSRKFCTFLDKGQIAVCTQPFTIRYFNDYFGEHFSDGGAISLYEEGIDGFQILERLEKPVDACRFCTFDEEIEWGVSKDPVEKSDWCVGN